MVQIESNLTEDSFRISLSPNRSLSWKSTWVIVILIALTCLSIGLAFTLVGASLILPFAGLEVVLVALCFYVVFKKTAVKEK